MRRLRRKDRLRTFPVSKSHIHSVCTSLKALSRIATVPTIGDAVEALNDVCSDLADTLKQIADISAELAARDHIRVDNIQEASSMSYSSLIHHVKHRRIQIVDIPDIAFLQDLDIRQKRSLVCREFERIRRDAKGKAKILFSGSPSLAYSSLDVLSKPTRRHRGDAVAHSMAALDVLFRGPARKLWRQPSTATKICVSTASCLPSRPRRIPRGGRAEISSRPPKARVA